MIRYSEVTRNLTLLPDFIAQYERELEDARKEVKITGNIETNLKLLPGITELRFGQLQEIEAVLKYLNIQQDLIHQRHYKKYLEGYARALSSRDAERYADNEQEVVEMKLFCNEVALLRNSYLGILKSLESKNFMLGHIVKLRVVGLEDASV